jgi:predicted DNA-binding transcriptional regulator YafY
MNRIDRLFGLVTLLQARRYTPAEHIATHFGISVRTVYRDISALGEQGIPVSFEPGRGYFLVPGYFLPRLTSPPTRPTRCYCWKRWAQPSPTTPYSRTWRRRYTKYALSCADQRKRP